MSRDSDLDALATRLLLYADSPLLERHRSMQNDLLDAAQATRDHAAVLKLASELQRLAVTCRDLDTRNSMLTLLGRLA